MSGPLANPDLKVFDASGRVVAGNHGWQTVGNTSAIFGAVGAFALRPFSSDAALVLTLDPGNYTAAVRGYEAGDSGEVLIEVYHID